MAPLFDDRSLQRRLDEDGFAVIKLLSRRQVRDLLELYEQNIVQAEVSGLFESSRHNAYDVNRVISETIRDQVAAAGKEVFSSVKILGGTFMVKSHAGSSMLPLHQDWSVVDETRHRTAFVWCALEKVTPTNGGLFVLPGSHHYFDSLRSGSYPSDRFILPTRLHRHVVDIRLEAGEALVYWDALFHGSHANNGPRDRIVATARVMEKDANLVYFQKANAREVDVFRADEEFYLTHIDSLAKGLMPTDAEKLERRPYVHVATTHASLEEKIRQHFVTNGGAQMKQLFKDPALQERFERDGYAVVDLIDREQVSELGEFYAGLRNAETPASGFQVSLDNESSEFVQEVSARLLRVVEPSIGRFFENHRIFTASFVTKQRNPLGVVPPHQDWSFVDESEFWSATIWCPLVDVTADNGALGLIKGSHRFYDHVRPSPSPQYTPPFSDQLGVIFPYLNIVELEAGQALVFNNQTLHASPPNTTDQNRLAFGIGITHQDAGLRHYYLLPGEDRPLIEGYEVEPEFFFSYNNARLSAMYDRGDKPTGLDSLGVFAMQSKSYDTDRLIEIIEAAGNRKDSSLAERVKEAFAAMQAGPAQPSNMGSSVSETAAAESRPFWKVYTPMNILREISHRLGKH